MSRGGDTELKMRVADGIERSQETVISARPASNNFVPFPLQNERYRFDFSFQAFSSN